MSSHCFVDGVESRARVCEKAASATENSLLQV
jgi:hypothetical protein